MACGEEGRQKSADLMFQYINDTSPIVPVCFEKQQVITHRGVISGMKPTKDNVFNGIDGLRKISNEFNMRRSFTMNDRELPILAQEASEYAGYAPYSAILRLCAL